MNKWTELVKEMRLELPQSLDLVPRDAPHVAARFLVVMTDNESVTLYSDFIDRSLPVDPQLNAIKAVLGAEPNKGYYFLGYGL